jgi:hypothetical protein
MTETIFITDNIIHGIGLPHLALVVGFAGIFLWIVSFSIIAIIRVNVWRSEISNNSKNMLCESMIDRYLRRQDIRINKKKVMGLFMRLSIKWLDRCKNCKDGLVLSRLMDFANESDLLYHANNTVCNSHNTQSLVAAIRVLDAARQKASAKLLLKHIDSSVLKVKYEAALCVLHLDCEAYIGDVMLMLIKDPILNHKQLDTLLHIPTPELIARGYSQIITLAATANRHRLSQFIPYLPDLFSLSAITNPIQYELDDTWLPSCNYADEHDSINTVVDYLDYQTGLIKSPAISARHMVNTHVDSIANDDAINEYPIHHSIQSYHTISNHLH